ncbi:hypothetical protein MVES1_002088 [Malassezia vespertilionis]|uniref:uncharacterized protein n=1 Tax=Malassezia vespertilionis TaxID=2020962 RepID=UPI0024B229BA|nr:uncharacterized protein MVES1_002088 [Malassezia vespertilionis]WFD06734.1 hypothetical protein MVES1_002088 [Malassezia vespertilionis]
MPRTEDDEAPSVPALPDLRTEQFFLSLARKDVHIPEVAVEEMHKHTHTNNATPWDKATGVSTLPMVYSVLMDQFFSPLWQDRSDA